MSAPETAPKSVHPDFPNKMEVINTNRASRYFGYRGVVYGSGPSKANPNNPQSVIYVCWPDGERFKYFAKSLAPAPLKESEYKVSTTIRAGKKVQVHHVPSAKRGRPTLFERLAAKTGTTL